MNRLTANPLIDKAWQKLKTSYRAYPLGYKLGVPGALLLILVGALLFSGPHLDKESLARIKNGMTPQQVTAIIGQPSESQTQGAVGLIGTTYIYHHGPKEIRLVFLNNSLMVKQGQF